MPPAPRLPLGGHTTSPWCHISYEHTSDLAVTYACTAAGGLLFAPPKVVEKLEFISSQALQHELRVGIRTQSAACATERDDADVVGG